MWGLAWGPARGHCTPMSNAVRAHGMPGAEDRALTMTGEEATFTVAGRVVEPGVTATVFTMVVPAGTLSTVGAEEGGIFWVAAAAAASAAIPLICGLLPITCRVQDVSCGLLHGQARFPLSQAAQALIFPAGAQWLRARVRT